LTFCAANDRELFRRDRLKKIGRRPPTARGIFLSNFESPLAQPRAKNRPPRIAPDERRPIASTRNTFAKRRSEKGTY
jgi:hypothetical protein